MQTSVRYSDQRHKWAMKLLCLEAIARTYQLHIVLHLIVISMRGIRSYPFHSFNYTVFTHTHVTILFNNLLIGYSILTVLYYFISMIFKCCFHNSKTWHGYSILQFPCCCEVNTINNIILLYIMINTF